MECLLELLKMSIPLIAVIFSWWLATKTANEKFEEQIKKETYDNFYSEILKACYELPSTDLLDFMSFYSYHRKDKISEIIIKNFSYVPPDIVNYWKKYNLALKFFEHDYEKDVQAREVLSRFLNYYSHLIIIKSLEESEKLSEELKLPQLSTQLLSPLKRIDFYKYQLPSQKLILKYHLQELVPNS